MDAARGDAENEEKKLDVDDYLMRIVDDLDEFMTTGEVFDRKELMNALEMMFLDKDQFGLLLGGKNTGKSQVLKHFASRNDTTQFSSLGGGHEIFGDCECVWGSRARRS